MLLPSDIARLVLGYLQQEKLASTCSAFIAESPDLKEYAEHYTDEGFVPGCLLSLFGKNLTTILNEYVSMKAKETTSEVPAMVSSLWKRLEYTLSQIRSMQNSAAYSAHQRARTRCGIADMRRQRMLESLTASSSSQQLGPSASNPSVAKPLIVRCALQAKSNPLFAGSSGTLENKMASDHGGKSTSTAVVCQKDGRHAHLMSPGRRKSESQRKRPHLTDKNIESSSFVLLDEQNDPLQELIDGNFPKMVIENAREKFLSNKSLQEKLAENINKFLGSDIAQASRPADSSAVDTDNAIDEILGLEGGEIHMSDEAIQDILQQTESDPAFQALFDLFDYGKHKDDRKTTEVACTHPEDIVNDSTLEEDCPDSVKTSLPLDSVSGKDVTNATRNSSTENEVSVNNITEKNTRPDAFENSLDKDGHNHGKHVSSEKVCNAVTKHPDNSVEKEEISKPTLVVLNMEHEKEKLDQGLLDVENNKQVCTIQTVATPEHDRPDSDHLQSPMDEGKSPGRKPPATPISPMVETHSAIVIETEKESSVSEHFTPNEQSLPGFGLTKPGVPEHSQVTSNVEMEDISSSKGRRRDLECEPDILNIAPLSEETNAKPFVAVPVKQSRKNDKGSTVPCQTSDCGKEHAALTEIAPVSPHSVRPIPGDRVDGHNIPVCLSPSQKEISCQPNSEEEQHQDEPEPRDALKSPVKNVDTPAAFSEAIVSTLTVPKEPVPSAATNINTDNLLQAIATIERENIITSSPSNTVATASFRDIVPGSESIFTIIDSSTVHTSAGNVPSSSSRSSDVDPSSIMSLNIIISDETSHSGDTELSNAVSSISGEDVPTIILSSPGKIRVQNVDKPQSASAEESVTSSERVADVVFVDQCLPLHTLGDQASSTLSFKVEDGTVFTLAPSLSQDGGFLQLIPASTSFGQSNNVYITTCMTDNGTFRSTASQSKITPISAKTQSQVQTPPRPRNMFSVGQTLSPKVSQGSTIIFASPVQPAMLQMGMIPLSVVGQNRNAYSAYPGQLLRMPAASPLGSRGMAKQPILPKNQKPIGSKSTIHTGRISKRKEDTLNHPPLFQPPRSETSDTVLPSEEQTKPEDNALLAPPSAPNANTKVGGSHRRVLCFEDGTSALEKASGQVPKPPTTPQNKERLDSLLHSLQAAVGASQYIKIMQSTDSNKVESNPPVVESSGMQSGVTGSRVASSSVKDADTGQRVAQSGASLDFHGNTSANKENKLRGSKEQQQKHDSPKFTASQEHNTFYDKTVPLVKEMSRKGILPNILRKSPHDPRKEVGKSHLISPLSKQAGEMLQDIQMRSPAPMQVDSGDLPLPRTPGSGMGILDCVRTPTCKNSSEEVGTPRALFLPATPELQGCSPASEAGSENSVSMAAHTLMILSRASIANTGSTTPLKDNTQQIKSRSTTKKRKLEETEECDRQTRLSKKETQSPPTPLKKKKIKKQKKKKLLDSFPAGMDVDKFLLSLHYDE
ncbi:hypothetical protein NDU88_001884 [Pleurodeles waltl]|uniref:Protein NPAT C-terminal domain-containing protein n=1 Tax=Pleurodeles waltl TaxID=8319 RepID=A0AAV7NGE8_PLEWA|nr:hypothetical protein NDU88_001884 [Pleurodeles waltl]